MIRPRKTCPANKPLANRSPWTASSEKSAGNCWKGQRSCSNKFATKKNLHNGQSNSSCPCWTKKVRSRKKQVWKGECGPLMSRAAVDDSPFNFTSGGAIYTGCPLIKHRRWLISCGPIQELPKEKSTIMEVPGLELSRGTSNIVSELCKWRSEGSKVNHRWQK